MLRFEPVGAGQFHFAAIVGRYVFHAGTAAEWLECPAAARLDAMRGCGARTAMDGDPCGVPLALTTASVRRYSRSFSELRRIAAHLFHGDTMARSGEPARRRTVDGVRWCSAMLIRRALGVRWTCTAKSPAACEACRALRACGVTTTPAKRERRPLLFSSQFSSAECAPNSRTQPRRGGPGTRHFLRASWHEARQ